MTLEIRWKAPEFEYHTKDVSWYWLSIIVAVLFLGAAVWRKNFLFGVFVIIGEILVLVWANKKPREVEFKITDVELEIVGERTIRYNDIESFSIDREVDEAWVHIGLLAKKNFKQKIIVIAPREKADAIEELLKSVLTQVEPSRSFLENLERFIRF